MWGCLASIVLFVAPALYGFGGKPWWVVAAGAAIVAFLSLFMRWSDTSAAMRKAKMPGPVALAGLYSLTFLMVGLVMAAIALMFTLINSLF